MYPNTNPDPGLANIIRSAQGGPPPISVRPRRFLGLILLSGIFGVGAGIGVMLLFTHPPLPLASHATLLQPPPQSALIPLAAATFTLTPVPSDTSVPSISAPTTTPIPLTVTPLNQSWTGVYHHIGNGGMLGVQPCAVVTGDAYVNGTWMADHSDQTGLVLLICSPATIAAPSGADVTDGLTPDAAEAFAKEQQQIAKQQGCGTGYGCPGGVSVLRWP